MKRLTTDTPDGNFETMLNFVYGKDGWAHIRHDGKNSDVPLTEWSRKQCLGHGCDEYPAESEEEIDQTICDCMMDFPDCPVALAYCFAVQAVHMRRRLKQYEDILFSEDETELVSLDQLRTMASQMPNPPLTLEVLREMRVMEWLWVEITHPYERQLLRGIKSAYYQIYTDYTDGEALCCGWPGVIHEFEYEDYGKTWMAYRRKPEEGTM